MFIYHTRIRLIDTDATGVLYFSQQFNFAMEAFEAFLQNRGFSWKKLMGSDFFLPVVHAEADYSAPLMVGDELEISLIVEKVGTSSITLQYILRDLVKKIEVGKVKIVHVAVGKKTRASTPLPDALRDILQAEVCK